MKKIKLYVGALLFAGCSLALSSCLGSFALTRNVIDWNNQVGSKPINELVFVAFWILPVYEVTALADLLVLNSIEFWSGKNPVSASTQVIETNHGRFVVERDAKGYEIKNEDTGETARFNFDEDNQTWSFIQNDTNYPFMTFVDPGHVKMITPEGDFRLVEISDNGVMAYRNLVNEGLGVAQASE